MSREPITSSGVPREKPGLLMTFDHTEKPLTTTRLRAALGYCWTHRKQLASAVTFGMGLLEAVQKAHG